MRILAGLTMFFVAMGNVVAGGDLDDTERLILIECLEEKGAVWGDCFANFREPIKAETGVETPTFNAELYGAQLAEEFGLSENLEGNLLSAIDIWAPNPYEAVIQSYISGSALAVGDNLLMR